LFFGIGLDKAPFQIRHVGFQLALESVDARHGIMTFSEPSGFTFAAGMVSGPN
jgi:hypothetical protein